MLIRHRSMTRRELSVARFQSHRKWSARSVPTKLALTLGCLFVAAPITATVTSAALDNDALYRSRLAEMLTGRDAPYNPLEDVPGGRRKLPVAAPSQRSISAAALAAATSYAASNNSAAFIVWRDGRIQAQSYFGGTSGDTLLKSKSLSKPLSAIAVGRALQLGKITSLDQSVADFIPEWKNTPKAAILIRHLLDMRSGLLPQAIVTDPESPLNRAYLDPDHGKYLVDHYPLTDPPGSKYAYSNATAELVAIVLERATGRRYAEFIGNEIMKPIGSPPAKIWIDRPGGLAHSGCCMMAPAEQWLRLAMLLLDDGVAHGRRLLPRGFVKEMTTPTSQNAHYGLGVWVPGAYVKRRGFTGDGSGPQILHSEPFADRSLFMFDGNHDQVVYISPATRMIIVRLGSMPPKTPEWDNSILPNVLLRGIIHRSTDRPLLPQR